MHIPGTVFESGDEGWNTFGISNNAFWQLIRGIAALELQQEYIHPDLEIVDETTFAQIGVLNSS